ncbi:MAG: heavy metal-associated domain-containing protein, partial [Planctomycetota bacterium]|nr:heavy metal-associated domain-containing protein [Planctomycetota bacterium]
MTSSARHTPTQLVPVEGMHCAGCVQSVETIARKVAGVERAEANFGTHQLLVEGAVDLGVLERALGRGGYRLGRRRTVLAGTLDAAALAELPGVEEVVADGDRVLVTHLDAPEVLARLRAALPSGAALSTERDPAARRLVEE